MTPVKEQLHGRHYRTIIGIALMAFALLFVITNTILTLVVTKTASPKCVASWVEFAHEWVFPIMLFAAGFALYNKEAFREVVGAGRSLVRRRSA